MTEAAASAHTNLNLLAREMERRLVGRKRVIRTMVVGLIAGHHTCLLGDPGTAKSYTARMFAAGLGYCPEKRGDYFELLLTKQTKDIEVLGAWKLQDVKKDEWNRKVENKLPAAYVALLDEIFKCNSGILNGLLTLLNEGLLHQDGGAYHSNLRAIVGCSNEMPNEDDNLEALWDRFLFRHEVTSVSNSMRGYKNLKKLKREMQEGKIGPMAKCASIEDAQVAGEAAKKVNMTDGVDSALFAMIKDLRQNGIPVSDRKLNQIEDALKAHAWLDGSGVVSVMHFDILRDVLWNSPDQKKLVGDIVDKHCVSPVKEAATVALAAVKMAEQIPDPTTVKNFERDAVGEKIVRVVKELDLALKEIEHKCGACVGSEKEEADALTAKVMEAKQHAKSAYGQLKFYAE
jgi:MoxR-like ATPase